MDRYAKLTIASFAGFVLAAVPTIVPAAAAPQRLIELPREDQGFPKLIQDVQKGRLKLALPEDAQHPDPAGGGIDECVAHCSNGVGW